MKIGNREVGCQARPYLIVKTHGIAAILAEQMR